MIVRLICRHNLSSRLEKLFTVVINTETHHHATVSHFHPSLIFAVRDTGKCKQLPSIQILDQDGRCSDKHTSVVINTQAQPVLFGYLYFILYIVQLTQTSASAHHFILIGIAYNGEISEPKHYVQTYSILKVQNKMFCNSRSSLIFFHPLHTSLLTTR